MKLSHKLLIIGKSASGKDTLASILKKKYGLKVLLSYSTRPPREDDKIEPKHIYVTNEEYLNTNRNDIMAHSTLYGYEYWSTKEQFNNCDIYVIDPSEAIKIRNQFKNVIIVAVITDDDILKRRIKDRGDSDTDLINKKLAEDEITHKNDKEIADVIIYNNGTIDEMVEQFKTSIRTLKTMFN